MRNTFSHLNIAPRSMQKISSRLTFCSTYNKLFHASKKTLPILKA